MDRPSECGVASVDSAVGALEIGCPKIVYAVKSRYADGVGGYLLGLLTIAFYGEGSLEIVLYCIIGHYE